MDKEIDRPTYNFNPAAEPKARAAEPVAKAPVEIDSDLVAYFQSQFTDWQGHVNDLLRFFVDTSQQKEREFANLQPEPDEAAPAPALTI